MASQAGQASVGLVVAIPLVLLVLLLVTHAGLRVAFSAIENTARDRSEARERLVTQGSGPIRPRWRR